METEHEAKALQIDPAATAARILELSGEDLDGPAVLVAACGRGRAVIIDIRRCALELVFRLEYRWTLTAETTITELFPT